MIRNILVLVLASLAALLALSCKSPGGTTIGEGGVVQPKLFCKMNNQCWICPDDAAMKKCIINPVSSGCKQGGVSECP